MNSLGATANSGSKEHGLVAPKRCKACRSKRKAERDPGMRGFAPPIPLSRARRAWWADPTLRFGLITVGLVVALAVFLCLAFRLDAVSAWLVAITLVTCLTYLYDKLIASSRRTRIPERVLLFLAFIGGTPSALFGMWLFRHKTAKVSFRLKFWLLVAAQVALVVAYYMWIRPHL